MSLLLFQIDLIFSLFHPFKSRLPSFFSCFFGTFIQHISICVAWVLILLCLCEHCYNHKHYYSNYPSTHAHLWDHLGSKYTLWDYLFVSTNHKTSSSTCERLTVKFVVYKFFLCIVELLKWAYIANNFPSDQSLNLPNHISIVGYIKE